MTPKFSPGQPVVTRTKETTFDRLSGEVIEVYPADQQGKTAYIVALMDSNQELLFEESELCERRIPQPEGEGAK